MVAVAAGFFLACGRQTEGSLLEGSVKGHEFSVRNAVFYPVYGNVVWLYTGDEESICAVLNNQRKPSHQVNLLKIALTNATGIDANGFFTPQPLVPGTYVKCIANGEICVGPDLMSSSVAYWTSDCSDIEKMSSTDSQVLVESFGGYQDGSHLVALVNLTFLDDHLSGVIDATYCAPLLSYGPACQPSFVTLALAPSSAAQ